VCGDGLDVVVAAGADVLTELGLGVGSGVAALGCGLGEGLAVEVSSRPAGGEGPDASWHAPISNRPNSRVRMMTLVFVNCFTDGGLL
jgi:hypothetical protein